MGVKIGFAGDFCPQARLEQLFLGGNWKPAFEEVKKLFSENQLSIVDLECPLIEFGDPIPKTGPNVKCLPDTVAILNYLGVEVVATANNHFYDYNKEGMLSTYKALEDNHIQWVGSGLDSENALKPLFIEREGLKFAVINVAENEWSTANSASPGTAPMDPVKVYKQITEARKKVDFIIVIAHGGYEFYNLPSKRIKELYQFFIDVGADAVISHHTHTISGHEVYKGCPIFYGVGNFCYDMPGKVNDPWNFGQLVQLDFTKGKPVNFSYIFIEQNNEKPGIQLLQDREFKKLQKHVNGLNAIIADDAKLEKEFENYCKSIGGVYKTWIQPYSGKYLASLFKRGYLPPLLGKIKRRLITNLIRTESHRDVLLNVLEEELKQGKRE